MQQQIARFSRICSTTNGQNTPACSLSFFGSLANLWLLLRPQFQNLKLHKLKALARFSLVAFAPFWLVLGFQGTAEFEKVCFAVCRSVGWRVRNKSQKHWGRLFACCQWRCPSRAVVSTQPACACTTLNKPSLEESATSVWHIAKEHKLANLYDQKAFHTEHIYRSNDNLLHVARDGFRKVSLSCFAHIIAQKTLTPQKDDFENVSTRNSTSNKKPNSLTLAAVLLLQTRHGLQMSHISGGSTSSPTPVQLGSSQCLGSL